MPNLELTYTGHTLPANITQQLIDYAENELNVPPSYLITKLHYEGLWGGSGTAMNNNNWGGMTWVTSWTSPYKRESGVTVTRGTPRPAIEGGHYISYESVNDFIIDWSNLIRLGGIYNVGNSTTFDEAVKGMFVYGGAQYDYATMNVTGSKKRYELYLAGMKGRRNAINNANNGVLDILDDENHSSDPNENVGNEDFNTIVNDINGVIDGLQSEFKSLENNLLESVMKMLSGNVFNYGNSVYTGNSFIKIMKVNEHMSKIIMNIDIGNDFNNVLESATDKLNNLKKQQKDIEIIDDEAVPETNSFPFFPTKRGLRLSSVYGWRIHPIRNTRTFHWGTDWSGGGLTHPLYSPQDAVVIENRDGGMGSSGAGWLLLLEHNGNNADRYFSRYMHLHVQSPLTVGTQVKKGDEVGTMGTTGGSTGIHLHFEIADRVDGFRDESSSLDPEKYLKMRF